MRNSLILGVLVVIGTLAGACGDDSSTSTLPETPKTTRQALPTSIPGEHEPGVCNFWTGFIDVLPDVSCDEAVETARAALAAFPDHADGNESAMQLWVSRICTGAASPDPLTYLPDEPHIPVLADALVGVVCPGDRAKIVAES